MGFSLRYWEHAPGGEVLCSWNEVEMGDFDIGSVSWVGGPWMGGPAAFCRGGAGGLAGGVLSIGVAGWLAGCAVRVAGLVMGLFGLWVWLRSAVPNFLSLLFFLFFFLCGQSRLSRFGTRLAPLIYRICK